jgi:hypothetical protein
MPEKSHFFSCRRYLAIGVSKPALATTTVTHLLLFRLAVSFSGQLFECEKPFMGARDGFVQHYTPLKVSLISLILNPAA